MDKNYSQEHNATVMGLIRQAFDVCERSIENLKCIPEGEYFLNLARQYYSPEHMMKCRPKVIVLGTDFPAEIVCSLIDQPPYWIIGGNNAFTALSDEDVPRDTDPVTRAVLGQLISMQQAKETALA